MFNRDWVTFATVSLLLCSLIVVSTGCDGPSEGPLSEPAKKAEEGSRNAMVEFMKNKAPQKGKGAAKH
ncbi:MAG: hypothetical protein P4L85_21715 [Paludisphaera borealis]|uniref:hypothetical protein n=1 Tax=Paludisphaera borealis TaxID=1387353 RepID=UPI00284F13B5|nr:hypothetical protein [Paludisphaera borealis]MDR3621983.1 hypothetical protein [Paludisphaera borealis]